MSDDPTPEEYLEERITELEKERDNVRKERDRLQREVMAYRTGGKGLAAATVLVVAGHSLVNAARNWIYAVSTKKRLPIHETADLAAAIIRRFVRVGLVGAVIALIPSGLLLWQNFLIRSQNQYFQEQTRVILADSNNVRRAQLLSTIYDQILCDQDTLPEGEECPPAAHPRSRTEAAVAFVSMERDSTSRSQDRLINLDGVDLRRAVLFDLDLQDVNFSNSDFRGSFVQGVDFSGSSFIAANLSDSGWLGSSFGGANLFRANLSESNFMDVGFFGASLGEATLQRSDFTRAVFDLAVLLGADLEGSVHDEASFRGTLLANAKASGASFVGANFLLTNLQSANLTGSSLRDAKLQLVLLQGADLTGTEVTKLQLLEAIIDELTLLPASLEESRRELLESSARNQMRLQRVIEDHASDFFSETEFRHLMDRLDCEPSEKLFEVLDIRRNRNEPSTD